MHIRLTNPLPPRLPTWASRCLVCVTVQQTAQTVRWLVRALSSL